MYLMIDDVNLSLDSQFQLWVFKETTRALDLAELFLNLSAFIRKKT